MEQTPYKRYSEYLKNKYGEKVYKLPVNLPVGCPNRSGGRNGCTFCSDAGTGFEALDCRMSVTDQLRRTKDIIRRKYHAHKFIAYFQNYTNTYMPLEQFIKYMEEAAAEDQIVELCISTRPDCIRNDYLESMRAIQDKYGTEITVEIGLQTVNYHTLAEIRRGHGIAEYIDAMISLKKYPFDVCTHLILNLPGDVMADCIETAKVVSALGTKLVKLHSLYIARNTLLSEAYENGTITICSKDEYIDRVIAVLEYLNPEIVVERLLSRIPEQDSIFSNWNTSWWKLQDEIIREMENRNVVQGDLFHYLNGSALN